MQSRLNTSTVSAAVLAVLAAAAATPAARAHEAAAAPAGLDEVIITARKREETLQSVPLAVTAFSAETIERASIRSIQDLAQFTPGLVYQDINGGLSLPVIRGLAQTNIAGSDNNVAMFLNGVYLSNNRTLDLGMIDLERVEVIKGPQSALYGQNSFAGAINYITRGAGENLGASAEATVGTDELREFRGSIGGPLGSAFGFRLSGSWSEFDGTFANRADRGDNLQGHENKGLSAQLEYRPGDRFSATLFGYHVDLESDQVAQYLVPNNCGNSTPAGGSRTYFCGELPASGSFDISPEGTRGRQATNTIASLALEWRFGEAWTLRSTTAYVESKSDFFLDFDFTSTGVPFPVVNLTNPVAPPRLVLLNDWLGQGQSGNEDVSQELRLAYASGRLDGSVGVYYYDSDRRAGSVGAIDIRPLAANENVPAGFLRTFATRDPINSPIASNLSYDTYETRAAFAQLGWAITDALRATVELRYTRDEKGIRRVLNNAVPVTVNPNQSASFSYTTPRLTVDYRLAPDALLYASYAKGTRSGGFNASATRLDEQSFAPESNQTYELGLKTQWLDRRLTLNLAGYYLDWTDLQISSRSQDPANIFAVVRNTGDAISSGFEIETRYAPTRNLGFGLSYAYVNPRFKQGARDLGLNQLCGYGFSICANRADPVTGAASPTGDVLVGGAQIGRTINRQYSAFIDASGNLGGDDRRWYARADWAWVDDQPIRADNVQFIGGYSLLNARIGVEFGRFEVALWGKNLTDERYLTAASAQPRFHTGNISDVTFGNGRIVGLSATARFGD